MDSCSKSSQLLEKLKYYSKQKLIGVVPCLIATLLGSIFFFICVVLSMFIQIKSVYIIISGFSMIAGLLGAIGFLFYTENLRKTILAYDFKTFLQVFVDDIGLKEDESLICENNLYYDVIDILIQKVRITYFDKKVTQSISDANYCLNMILLNNAPVGLANRFVYENRRDFLAICDKILSKCDNWNLLTDYNEIMSLYNDNNYMVDSHFKQVQSRRTRNKLINFINCTKKVVLAFCIIVFACQLIIFAGDYISLIFNFVAILLIGFDLLERRLMKYGEQ